MQYFAYMRISTKEERDLQRYTRQQKAIDKYCDDKRIELSVNPFCDDTTGANFNRPAWIKLEKLVNIIGDDATIIFKDISRFSRNYDDGYNKFIDLMNKGVNLVFLDNPTLSTDYIKQMQNIADSQTNRIAKQTLNNTIQLLLMVELDRAEQERAILIKRIKDGLCATEKPLGRPRLKIDDLTPELQADIENYLKDRSIKAISIMRRYNICFNTFKKYKDMVIANQNK